MRVPLRHERTGSEPVTAFSALRLRLLLSLIFVPLFVVAAVLLGVWWLTTDPGAAAGGLTSRDAIGMAACVCAVAALVALADLFVVLRRLRRERGQRRSP